MYALLPSLPCVLHTPPPLNLLNLIVLEVLVEEYKLWRSSLFNFLIPLIIRPSFSLLGPRTPFRALFSKTPSIRVLSSMWETRCHIHRHVCFNHWMFNKQINVLKSIVDGLVNFGVAKTTPFQYC
jgi:hypothetical protein